MYGISSCLKRVYVTIYVSDALSILSQIEGALKHKIRVLFRIKGIGKTCKNREFFRSDVSHKMLYILNTDENKTTLFTKESSICPPSDELNISPLS